MRGSGFRCETDHSCFEFTSAEASGNLGFPRGIHSFLHSFNQSFRIQSCFEFTSAEASGNLGFPRGKNALFFPSIFLSAFHLQRIQVYGHCRDTQTYWIHAFSPLIEVMGWHFEGSRLPVERENFNEKIYMLVLSIHRLWGRKCQNVSVGSKACYFDTNFHIS